MAPKDENELQHMLKTMVEYNEGPSAMRIPRGAGVGVELERTLEALPIGRAEVLRDGKDVVFLAYGTCVYPALEAAALLDEQGVDSAVVNARFVKPLDTEVLDELLQSGPALVTCEEGAVRGGFGSAVVEYMVSRGYDTSRVRMLGVPDRFIEHAPRGDLLAEIGLTAKAIAQAAVELLPTPRPIIKSVTGKSA